MTKFNGVKILILFVFFVSEKISGQCINTFPYTQNFENIAAWTAGGINSDWAWGAPSKAVITGAGGGSKCWVVGGLSGSSYNGSQQSFIKSPCYDLSSLTCPAVSFKVFWEMENKYDGAGLQYSTDNGNSWNSVGAFNDPANCVTSNWYNNSNINYLSSNSKQGWSGNSKSTAGSCQGGSGSLGWVEAKHCLANLAGKTNVLFRFVFGSGTSCNSFDGFAIDDFTINNALVGAASFTNSCTNFAGIDSACQKASSYLWNFGDPLSGSANTSTLINSIHLFSTPGIYNVTLSSFGGACSASTSVSKLISIVGSSISSVTNANCKGAANGSAAVTTLFNVGACSYTWSPEGGSAATASSLTAGNYSVFITDMNGCKSTSTVNISEPNPNTGSSSQTINTCSGDKTQLKINLSGINDPISYLWSIGSDTNSSIYVTPSVTTIYSASISTSGTCAINEQKLFTVQVAPKPHAAFSSSTLKGCAPLCPGLKDESTVNQGTLVKREWSFNNGMKSNFESPGICFESSGVYSGQLTVSNSFGCSAILDAMITITVLPSPLVDFTANNFKAEESEPVNFRNLSSPDVIKWEWNFGGLASSINANPNYSFNDPGDYHVLLTVTDSAGCNNTIIRDIKVLPGFTFFAPNSFTPNNDQLNDSFFPKGMGWDPNAYEFWIFDRWGQKLFYTTNPFEGWKGEQTANGVYVWKVELLDLNKKQHSYMGTVLLSK